MAIRKSLLDREREESELVERALKSTPSELLVARIFRTGIVIECCLNSCTIEQMMHYCKKPSNKQITQ